jgi:hypothetical protein
VSLPIFFFSSFLRVCIRLAGPGSGMKHHLSTTLAAQMSGPGGADSVKRSASRPSKRAKH